MRMFLSLALISAIGLSATCANAQGYRYGPRYYHRDNGGAVVAAGLIGLIAGAAIASSNQQPRQAYNYAPQSQPAYGGGNEQVWCHQTYNPFQGQVTSCNTFFNGDLPSTPGWWRR